MVLNFLASSGDVLPLSVRWEVRKKASVRLKAEAEFGKPPQALGPNEGSTGWGCCRIYRVEVLNDEFPNCHRKASSAHLGVGEGENDFGRVVDVDSI
jgi:hypothetical protein